MDKIGQPRKQGDRSSPLKEGKPPKAKRKVYTYTCSLCTLEVQSDHQRSLDDKHGAAAEMHGHRAVRRFTGCVPRPQPPLLFLVFALTHPLSPLLASFWVLQARTKRRCRP